MKLLLDTHAFLWMVDASPELPDRVRELLEADDTDLYPSIASVWEMAIKMSLGKLSIPAPLEEFIPEQVRINDLILMSIELPPLGCIVDLPFHHKDPIDRL